MEEQLIEHVVRLKTATPELTAGQVHAALLAEGVDVELAAVKKAASKATKRMLAAPPAAPVPVPAPPNAAAPSKQESKRATAAAEALKAAEVAMMTAQKALHQERYMVAMHGAEADTKGFVDKVVALAISAVLEPDEPAATKERVEADVATLQYVLLGGSPFELPDDQRVAARAQLEKLEAFVSHAGKPKPAPFVSQPTFQGARTGFVFKTGPLGLGYYHEAWCAGAMACYVPAEAAPPPPAAEEAPAVPLDPALREVLDERHAKRAGVSDMASLDRAMAKASMLADAGGASAMDDMD